jgi:hypothetical protein
MAVHEIRDPETARQFVVQSLWLQRVILPTAAGVRPALEWALEIAAGGHPLPPVGFVADIGHVLLGTNRDTRPRRGAIAQAGVPVVLTRTYEDLVLGKVFADRTIERAGDAVHRYQGRDRSRAVAFIVNQFHERAGFGGVLLSPAILKALLDAPADEVLSHGWDSLSVTVQPPLVELYEELIASTRRMAEILGPEDVFELEHGTALAELGQRVALRQVLQMAARLESSLPKLKPRPRTTSREVPTRALDEDTYPVGGFASISTRGTIESLLHSQLVFMEPATEPRPDLFDVRFVRDELLYYSRDENQFLRRRRGCVIALLPDLVRAQFKDVELPTQRIVLVLAVLVVAVRKLTDWLAGDALTFDFIFVGNAQSPPLFHEEALLATLLREPIANGTVRLSRAADLAAVEAVVMERARRGTWHSLSVGSAEAAFSTPGVGANQVIVAGPRPRLANGGATASGNDPWDDWLGLLQWLLKLWF